ncbi:MAG: PQQ-binding-like beta-propeller repeat protein [Gemmatimonadetes bacterium]|nr:PQQ-binding-like beta-propeller repeat protein [Gemmatimonadota bacterium]
MVAEVRDRYRFWIVLHGTRNIARRSILSTRTRRSCPALAAVLASAAILIPGALPAQQSPNASWEELWRLELSRGASAPLVWADSLLVVASLDRNLHFVAPGTPPRVAWKENFDGGFEAAPVVTADHLLLSETRSGAHLVALDRRTRQIAWRTEAGDLVAPPILHEERIYTVSSIGEVHAYGTGGTPQWTSELKTRVVSAPILLGTTLVIAASNGKLFALNAASGVVQDSIDTEAGSIWGHPVVRAGSPSTALYATLEGQLLEVDGDLEILQRRSFPSRFYAGPVAAGELLFLVGHEGTLWAYDWPAANVVWQRALPGTFRAPPTVAQGVVAAGDLAGTFYVVDRASGDLLWRTDLDGAITSQPLARGGTLYAVTEHGTLYAFRPVPGGR